jgi:hypothetical protein
MCKVNSAGRWFELTSGLREVGVDDSAVVKRIRLPTLYDAAAASRNFGG